MAGGELEPFEGIGFESMVELLGTLTPKRWELIQRLRQEGPMNSLCSSEGVRAGL